MEKEKWWKKAVVYQIYPRSFYDANGDGIGDLRGIIEKLDYIRDLGANVIWLCPVYKSPMDDNGYDIADYYHIDEAFGTDEDMDELIAEAKKRGIRIIMDLVVNHCSDEHKWFQKAKADPEGPYGKYFYIKKGIDGKAPNNWRSIFGGSAWEPIEGTDYYYLHIFTKKQPDLNWENKELREEIYKMVNWWLDKGIGGFRLDAITYLKKEAGLPSYPADGEDGLVSVAHGALNQPGIEALLREFRDRTYGRRETLTVGETAGLTPETLLSFISLEDGVFSMVFEFSWCQLELKGPNYFWYDRQEWTPEDLKRELFSSHEMAGDRGWFGVCTENHDQPRSIDHYLPREGRNYYGATMLASMYLLLRGTPYVYQGQEIGIRNCAYASMDDYNDVSTHNQYNRALADGFSPEEALRLVQLESRDNARTPFQWDDTENAGFTTGKPWLKVNPNYTGLNAAQEERDEDSVLTWYKKMIGLRLHSQWSELISEGTFAPAYREEKNLIAYRRSFEGKTLLVLCNMQPEERELTLVAAPGQVLADNYKEAAFTGNTVRLRPYEVLIAEEA